MTHRTPAPRRPPAAPAPPSDPLLRATNRLALILAGGNGAVGIALLGADPGTSPALLFLRAVGLPLPVWGAGFLLVTVLVVVRQHAFAHLLAVVLWTVLASGAVLGVISGSSTAPAASLILTALTVMAAGMHVNGLLYRRRQAR